MKENQTVSYSLVMGRFTLFKIGVKCMWNSFFGVSEIRFKEVNCDDLIEELNRHNREGK